MNIFLLKYKTQQDTIRRTISEENKIRFDDIRHYAKYTYNIKKNTTFINEAGLYELINKSRSKEAINFRSWLTSEVLPSLRKKGKYELNTILKKEIKTMNEKMNQYKRKILLLENNNKKPVNPKGGYIYLIQPPTEKDEKKYKIGKTKNIDKRLNVYNTAYPDKVLLIHKIKVDDPDKTEKCVKVFLDDYQYKKRKEFYKISKSIIINVMNNCSESLKSKTFEKRKIQRMIKTKEQNNDIGIFGIFSFTKEEENEQKGGSINLEQLYVQKVNELKNHKSVYSLFNRMSKFNDFYYE